MRAYRDFLASVESMMTDWLRRQRAAFDASNRSVRKICDSRNIIVVAQAQAEWVSDCLEWTASNVRAVGNDAAALTRKATERFREARARRTACCGSKARHYRNRGRPLRWSAPPPNKRNLPLARGPPG